MENRYAGTARDFDYIHHAGHFDGDRRHDHIPLDRGTILTSSPFDVKVEFDGVVSSADVDVTVNGKPVAEVFGKDARFIEREEDVELRPCASTAPRSTAAMPCSSSTE